MKKLVLSLSVLFLSFGLQLNAQVNRVAENAGQTSENQSSEAKQNFIKNQSYLSKSSLKDYKNYYGDSLRGFEESKIRAELLGKGISGQEIAGHMLHLKRLFIKDKYHVGEHFTVLPSIGNTDGPIGNPQTPNNQNGGTRPIGGGAVINVSPCVNEGFESSSPGVYQGATNSVAITGWTLSSRTANSQCPPTNWNNGATGFSLVATPIINYPVIGTIPNSPLGGTVVAKMNNDVAGDYSMNRMIQTFPVTNANTLFQFAYAGYWQDGGGGHGCCDQPGVYVKMYNCSNNPLACSSLSLAPGSGCQSTGTNYTVIPNSASWTNWQVKFVDLTPFIGGCVTIEVYTTDCGFGGHYGTTFFDSMCGGQLIGTGMSGTGGNIAGPVSFCAGSGVAQISAPLGYSSYQWIAPGPTTIAAPQGTMSTLTVSNPIPGSVYTVQLVSPSGCQYVSTNTIVFTQVNIAGIGTSSSCLNGASGSATVQGNGSGSGYTYTWTNSSNSVVGTQSIATNLAAGVYSIGISGLGASGCGSAVTTVTVNTAPPGVIPLLKPFCGNQAFLTTNGGSNFKWYNNMSLITGTAGAVAIYTVNNPVNNSIYRLSYLSNQGCQDSIQYTLLQSAPGAMSITNISWICPGGTNGTAMISMTPAVGSPPGFNSFSVTNNPASTTTAAYNASLVGTSVLNFSLGALSAGNYSVSTFDGSCKYNATFNVIPFVYNFTVNPASATLCPGNAIAAGVSFTSPVSPSQYSYTWSPNVFLAGNNANLQSTIIQPTAAPGTSVTVNYSITVTPSTVNCPMTRTMSITSVNPPTPTITPIPDLCDNGQPHQIIVTPTGGTFYPVYSGTNNPISNTGLISPNSSGINLGPNVFSYAIRVNTCQASQSATYQVSHFNPSTLTSSISPQCVTNGTTNLMNIVQSTATGTSPGGSWPSAGWSGAGVSGSGANTIFSPAGLQTSVYPIVYNTFSTPIPTVCPSSSTLFVSVTETLVPNIAQVPAFCTNAAPIAMTVNPTGGTWSNPAVNAVSGIITPSSAITTNSIVNYVVNIGPCVNTGSTVLNISQFNPATITGTVPNLCYNSPNFNLMSIVQFTSNGSWSGTNVNGSNLFSPANLSVSATPNIYSLVYTRLSVPNTSLCPDSKTINVSVYNPPTPIIAQSGPYCSKDMPTQLAVSPNIGNWVSSSYLSSGGVLSPSLCSIGNNAVQYVIGTNTCFTQHTKFLSVEAFASAAILSSIPDQCNTNSPINLSPFTQSSSGVWNGAGISGTSFNPANTGAGNFVLTYKTSSSPSGLCPDQSTIAVNVYSLAAPVLDQMPVLCNSSKPQQIIVSPVGGIFGGANNTGVSNKGLFDPANGVIGNNVINYSITSGPCVAYAQTTINVVKFVSADLAKYPKEVYCKNIDEPINLDALVHNPGGYWSINGVPSTNMFNPNTANAGLNVITYSTNSIPSTSICPDVKSFNIKVGESMVVTVIPEFPAGIASGCAPFPVVFSPQTNVGKGFWDFGDGSEPQADVLRTSHVYTSPGTYTAVFNYISADGCPSKPLAVNPTITVHEAPVANFTTPDEVLVSNPDVQLTNLTSMLNTNKYQWVIEGMYTVTDINPIVKFDKVGKHQITLIAESAKGCKNQITKTLEVKNDFNVFIPSSFTPNFDGINDLFIPVFSPYGLDNKSFEMEIFDRWGHSIFRSKDVTKGWDGSLQNKGETLKEEVYIYKIKFKDLDGNLYNKMGHVSLIK